MSRKAFLSFIFVLFFLSSHSQGYRIGISIKGLSGDTILLGYHFGDKQFISDTTILDARGNGIFQGEEKLAGGIYLIVMPGMKYFEILISSGQHFSLSTDMADLTGRLRFRDSPENEQFIAYQQKMISIQERGAKIQARIRANPDSAESYRKQLADLEKESKAFNRTMRSRAPASFLSNIIGAMSTPEIPDFDTRAETGNSDSVRMVKTYYFNRVHFFDEYAFGDSSLLRTPIFHNKMNYYFTRMLIQSPDSLIPAMDEFLARCSAHPAVMQYALVFLMNHYVKSNIMGMDAVYIHLAETYYLTGNAPWADSEYIKKLEEQVIRNKPNLIGLRAKDLVMESVSGEWFSLLQVKARYTVLYFWEPDCGHCREETPALYTLYSKWKEQGLEVFAVYTQAERERWSKYVEENNYTWINVYDPGNTSHFRQFYNVYSTPTLYLLDENKKIIAKRISVETLGEMLERLYSGLM